MDKAVIANSHARRHHAPNRCGRSKRSDMQLENRVQIARDRSKAADQRKLRSLWIGLVYYMIIVLNAMRYVSRVPFPILMLAALLKHSDYCCDFCDDEEGPRKNTQDGDKRKLGQYKSNLSHLHDQDRLIRTSRIVSNG
jgi:hypothetical protein